MRTKQQLTMFAVIFASLLLTGSAFANTVNMKYLGQHGQIGSYDFSINGSSTTTVLICDAFDNRIGKGETWQATKSVLLSATGLFGSGGSLDYRAAGLIYKSMLMGTTKPLAGQWAIWALFSANAASNPEFVASGGSVVEATYLALAAIDPNSAYKGLWLYTPIAGTQGNHGLPQEFIGFSAVPEPGTLTLMGTGLICLAGALRRKLARS
jgi:hypothetical protein